MLVRSPDSLPQLSAHQADHAHPAHHAHQALEMSALASRPPSLPPTRRRRAVSPQHLATTAKAPPPRSWRRRAALAVLTTALAAVALVALGQLRGEPAPAPLTAERVLAGVVARYASVEHLSAELRLTTTNFSFPATAERDGHLTLARGGKLRWDVLAPAAADQPRRLLRSLVSDGETLTLVDLAQRELVKLHRPDDQLAFATSALLSPTLAADFTAQLASLEGYLDDERGLVLEPEAERPRYALALLPRAANPRAQRLILLVDEHMAVRQLVLENPYSRTRLVLGGEDTRTRPQPGWFVVDPASPALAGFRFVDAEL